ncbi:unnamed protein product [Caenorhabditis nigoni]
MDSSGASSSRQIDDDMEVEERRQAPETPRKKRNENPLKEPPEDSDDEEQRAEQNGTRNFPAILWSKLKNPPKDRPTIDVWEFKMDGEYLTMTFTVDGEKYPMYFTPRSPVDFEMRRNYWIARHNPLWKSLRSRIYSIPKSTTINRLVFHNTPECEAEDCLIEFQFIKKWSCRQLEYTICQEWNHPQHLRRLMFMFKPSEMSIHLAFGPYAHPNPQPEGAVWHNHLAACADNLLELERDFRKDCENALNGEPGTNAQMLYAEAGKGKAFGMQLLRTMKSLQKFVTMMVEAKMLNIKGLNIRKFIVNGPTGDKLCHKLQNLFKEEGVEESNRKRASYANGEKIFVCVRGEMRRAYKYSLAMPATAFKMQFGNDLLLSYTKIVPHFHCLFRTSVDEKGAVQLITEWYNNQRQFDEIQLHVDKVIETNFVDHLGADHSDPKRIKVRRTHIVNNRRHVLHVEKDRLATRHLSLRVYEQPK